MFMGAKLGWSRPLFRNRTGLLWVYAACSLFGFNKYRKFMNFSLAMKEVWYLCITKPKIYLL